MSVLTWNKPKKIMTTEERNNIVAESAPPGVYVSNMSPEDEMKWKAKLVGHKVGRPQVEIRRNGMVMIVSLGNGYKYKNYKPENNKGVNIHIASSVPQQLTFEEFDNMKLAVEEARQKLIEL